MSEARVPNEGDQLIFSRMELMGQVAPRPIDGGQVAQSVVEYIGPRMGGLTYRPPSGWSYSFSGLPSGRVQYVRAQDLDFFRLRPDFRVLDEGRIDPEAERLKRMEGDIFDRLAARIGERSDEYTTTDPSRSPRRRGGRPSGRGFGVMLDCWMTCTRLADYYGSVADAYDAVERYFRTTLRLAGKHPRESDTPVSGLTRNASVKTQVPASGIDTLSHSRLG